MPTSATKAPVQGKRTGMTKDLRELDQQIVKTYKEAEQSMAALFLLVAEAIRRNLPKYLEFKNMTEYLMARLPGCSQRNAQHFVRTVTVWIQCGLDMKLFTKLGPTMSRELANYALKAQPKKQSLLALVGRIEKENWTVDQLADFARQQVSQQQLTGSNAPKDESKELRKGWNLRVSDSQREAIMNAATTLAATNGTDDIPTIIENTLAQAAAEAGTDPEDCIGYAKRAVGGIETSLRTAMDSAFKLNDAGDPGATKAASKLLDGVIDVTLDTASKLGEFVDIDLSDQLDEVISRLSKPRTRQTKTYRRRAFNMAFVLLASIGADKSLLNEVSQKIRPDD